jgi:anti-sigma factor RsiW
MPDCAEYRVLMMGLMDNELTPEETADVNQHLIRCESCRKEYDELSRSYSKLGAVSFSGPSDDELDRIWKNPFSRFTRNAGLFIVFAGWITLIIYSLVEFFSSDREPILPKMASVGIIIGIIILLYAVLSDRLKAFKTDPYKEVER